MVWYKLSAAGTAASQHVSTCGARTHLCAQDHFEQGCTSVKASLEADTAKHTLSRCNSFEGQAATAAAMPGLWSKQPAGDCHAPAPKTGSDYAVIAATIPPGAHISIMACDTVRQHAAGGYWISDCCNKATSGHSWHQTAWSHFQPASLTGAKACSARGSMTSMTL
ncbi:hypothetical protein WJX73_006605 [Symbiochloris irregularis]|uniref:Uncharacterized protein n=1 Tax=Symbiochloris irregularis TaxID=706552 RepID=A0AAW1PY62_9CHLO